jgi:hypothetical protein
MDTGRNRIWTQELVPMRPAFDLTAAHPEAPFGGVPNLGEEIP